MLNAEILVSNIIMELNKDRETRGIGLSPWDIYKILKKRDTSLTETKVKYYVKKLYDMTLIEKNKSKYRLESMISFNKDGSIIVANPPTILICPFHDNCDCKNGFNKDCKYFKSMPEFWQELFLKHWKSLEKKD